MKIDNMNPDYYRLSMCLDIVHHKTPQNHIKEQRKMPDKTKSTRENQTENVVYSSSNN